MHRIAVWAVLLPWHGIHVDGDEQVRVVRVRYVRPPLKCDKRVVASGHYDLHIRVACLDHIGQSFGYVQHQGLLHCLSARAYAAGVLATVTGVYDHG